MGEISNIRSQPRPIPVCLGNYKADGASGGGISFAIVGDHENRPTDMTNLVIVKVYEQDSNREEVR